MCGLGRGWDGKCLESAHHQGPLCRTAFKHVSGKADFSPNLSDRESVDECLEGRQQKCGGQLWNPSPSLALTPKIKPRNPELGRTQVKSRCWTFRGLGCCLAPVSAPGGADSQRRKGKERPRQRLQGFACQGASTPRCLR